jgi:hypothetical protein
VMLTAAGYEVHRTTYRMLLINPDPLLEIVRDSLKRRTASNSASGR